MHATGIARAQYHGECHRGPIGQNRSIKIMRVEARILVFACLCSLSQQGVDAFVPTANGVDAFVPTANLGVGAKRSQSQRYMSADRENALREEIAQNNVNTVDEEKYAIADGADLEKVDQVVAKEEAAISSVEDMQESEQKKLLAKLDRIVKPRAYPLFMAEKAAEIAETTISDLTKGFKKPENTLVTSIDPSTRGKERVVVLGTGWGAAALVKTLDPAHYDITVVSPRNYFGMCP